MGDGLTDINTPLFKDPFCLERSVVDRAEWTRCSYCSAKQLWKHTHPGARKLASWPKARSSGWDQSRGSEGARAKMEGGRRRRGFGNWGRLLSEALMGFLRQGSAHFKGEVWSQVILVPSGVWNSCQNKLSWECKAGRTKGNPQDQQR